MDYKQMMALEKGERLAVLHNGEWKKGTFDRYISGADPSMWFAFDDEKQGPNKRICTRVYTGLQWGEDYWNEKNKDKKFRKLSEDELNAELIGKMGVEA